MKSTPKRFTDWIPLSQTQELPGHSGIFQIRVCDRLLPYPTGKSAMFYYGYCARLSRDIKRFAEEIVPQLDASRDELLVRWIQVVDLEKDFQRYLESFRAKFGSLPAGNEELLRGRQPD